MSWEGQDCWFVAFKGMKEPMFALMGEDPKNLKRAEGGSTYTQESILFSVKLNEQEKALGLIRLRDAYIRGQRPGFELRQHLEYGGS